MKSKDKHYEKDNCYCDMRGFLSFIILFFLSKKEMNGQEIASEIARRKGSKPSPGTIYPALKSLREEGLIQEKKQGKLINYHLTEKGKRGLKEAKKRFCKVFSDILKN